MTQEAKLKENKERKMQIVVRVTQDHIDKGRPCRGSFCAISQALSEVIKEGVEFTTYRDYSDAEFTKEGIQGYTSLDRIGEGFREQAYKHKIPLGKPAAHFINTFDTYKNEAKPFSFIMDIPEEYLKSNVGTTLVETQEVLCK